MEVSKHFTALYDSVMTRKDLTLDEKVLLCVLYKWFNWYQMKGLKYTPSNAKLADTLGCTTLCIASMLGVLSNKKAIKITHSDNEGTREITVL